MKVRASVKPMCEKCKVIKRKGVVSLIPCRVYAQWKDRSMLRLGVK